MPGWLLSQDYMNYNTEKAAWAQQFKEATLVRLLETTGRSVTTVVVIAAPECD